MHSITVVGTGYVGLVTGACLADFGNDVTCVDGNPGRIESLGRLELPFFEPGLPEMVSRNVHEGRLRFSHDLPGSLSGPRVVFITVGTPSLADGSADVGAIYEVARVVAENLDTYKLLVQKSTAPVGTSRKLADYVRRLARRGARFDVASNPEFLREGSAIETFMRPDRVVIGAETRKAADLLRRIYAPLFLIETPIVVTNLETAELIKYASNAFLATKISFINEVANLCEALGADVQVVAKGIGMDRRIGPKFLHAGPGYGGSCLPKDTRAMASLARRAGARSQVVEATIAANQRQLTRVLSKVVREIGAPRGKRVAVLGLSFKPNTDDLREAPALAIVSGLKRRGVRVVAFDPVAMPRARALPALRGVELAQDAYRAMRGADALVIVTEWNEFRNMDLGRMRRLMRRPVLFDLRNIYDPAEVEQAGVRYVGVGRGSPGSRARRSESRIGRGTRGIRGSKGGKR